MDRVILHCDMNNFYASVECLRHPELRDKPVIVCGDPEQRHGIVLAKNYLAKQCDIKTGDTIWEAKRKCKNLTLVTADFPLYLRYSRMARKIYERYTNQIESFGIDECWLDVTGSQKLFGNGKQIADKIREDIKKELGCTVSVGVSWNKIFAKLGSDMKKPDATTVISKENYKDTIYKLPAGDLLYVGRATKAKLYGMNINTIGEIANADIERLRRKFGKWGEHLWIFANGLDASPVSCLGDEGVVKSVGNSTTTVRDLTNREDVLIMVALMSESVAARLREQGLKGQVISVWIRDNKLEDWGKQTKIAEPTFLAATIIKTAMKLYDENYTLRLPIRSVGVTVSDLSPAESAMQMSLFDDRQDKKAEALEKAIDILHSRFGNKSIRRGILLLDKSLTELNPKEDNVIHPYSYF